jgi:hypothetical protein
LEDVQNICDWYFFSLSQKSLFCWIAVNNYMITLRLPISDCKTGNADEENEKSLLIQLISTIDTRALLMRARNIFMSEQQNPNASWLPF